MKNLFLLLVVFCLGSSVVAQRRPITYTSREKELCCFLLRIGPRQFHQRIQQSDPTLLAILQQISTHQQQMMRLLERLQDKQQPPFPLQPQQPPAPQPTPYVQGQQPIIIVVPGNPGGTPQQVLPQQPPQQQLPQNPPQQRLPQTPPQQRLPQQPPQQQLPQNPPQQRLPQQTPQQSLPQGNGPPQRLGGPPVGYQEITRVKRPRVVRSIYPRR